MSCFEWEQGQFRIPAKCWPALKKALRAAYNKGLAADLTLANQVIAKVKAAHKGRRLVDWRVVLTCELGALDRVESAVGTVSQMRYRFNVLRDEMIILKAFAGTSEARRRLCVLRRKDFPLANRETMRFPADLGTISLCDAKHLVSWDVSEHNRACEGARSSYMGRTLFRFLEGISWVRGTGGYITGNDEHTSANLLLETDEHGDRLKLPYHGPIGMERAAVTAGR